MTGLTLSVVTPSYNQADYLEENLQSVGDQSYEPIEHVVVDGGSTDGSVEILESYEDTYNLRWVSEPDRGQSHALNKGIEMATGEWIGFQMSDDYYLDGALTTVAGAIERNPGVDVVYGDVINVGTDGTEQARTFNIPPTRFVHRYWSLYANSQSTFFRDEILADLGGFKEELDYTMDADLFWRLFDMDVTQVHVPEFLAAWRYHPAAKTPTRTDDQRTKEWDAIYGDYGTTLERYFSTEQLELAAKIGKAIQLLRIGRIEAFKYNLSEKL